MSVLTAASLAALLTSCAPDGPHSYMISIMRVESGFDPYAIHDNTTKRSYSANDIDHAVSLARNLVARGDDIDVGLGQINHKNWKWLGLTVETALDPCQNIRAEARVLDAMSRYNTGDARRGLANGYVMKVLAQAPADAAPQQKTEAQKPPDDTEGDDKSLTTTYEGK